MRLSVVIPTLNEEQELPQTLERLAAVTQVLEVIISDGGSSDGTEKEARRFGAQWLMGCAGRGGQLRRGAAFARGDCVMLLHADTWLPATAGESIARALEDSRVVGGGFRKQFREGPWLLRSTAKWRSSVYFRLTGRLFGDQALFVRREVLESSGGVPDLPLMEELTLCRQIKAYGHLVILPGIVSTSGRTFRDRSVLGTWWLMWRLQVDWKRGVPAEELAQRYRR